MNDKGKYIYAVVNGREEDSAVPRAECSYGSIGIDGSPVYTISAGQVAAVVSEVHSPRVRPQRSHLAAHQRVLKQLMEESTPLPMSFGVIAGGTAAIHRILSNNQERFVEQLQRVAGKVEMGLSITYGVSDIFDYFVTTHPELQAVRERIFGAFRNPTQEEKIELGRMFERSLDQDRETHTAVVEGVLSAHCVEIQRNKCRSEYEVANLACLVGREAQAEFEAGIFAAARLFDNNFAFDYNGPWAPHNFVELDLEI